MSWIYFAGLTALGFALSNAFIKLSAGNVNAFTGIVFLHLTSGLIALVVMMAMSTTGYSKISFNQPGVIYSMLAGGALYLGALSFLLMFDNGAPLGVGVLISALCTTVFALLISLIFFKEAITLQQSVGVITALISMYLLVPKS